MSDLSERARSRLRDEMLRKKLSQRDMAGILGWSQSRVGKLLTGRVEIGLSDLEALCFALTLAPTEVVRDHGLEFAAEMTPTELRILERIRQLPPQMREALMTFIQVNAHTPKEERRALPKRTPKKRIS